MELTADDDKITRKIFTKLKRLTDEISFFFSFSFSLGNNNIEFIRFGLNSNR
jgi:hypothetical protein